MSLAFFFSAVRLGLYIVYELTWSLKTKTFETYALEKILDLVIVTTCKPKYSVLISSRGQTLRTLASYNWTDYFFSVEEELFFSFVFPPIFFFFFWRRCSPQYIFFFWRRCSTQVTIKRYWQVRNFTWRDTTNELILSV